MKKKMFCLLASLSFCILTISNVEAVTQTKKSDVGTMTASLNGWMNGSRKCGVASTDVPKAAKKVIAKFSPKIYSSGASAGDTETDVRTNSKFAQAEWECHSSNSSKKLKYYSTHEVIHTNSTVVYLSYVY